MRLPGFLLKVAPVRTVGYTRRGMNIWQRLHAQLVVDGASLLLKPPSEGRFLRISGTARRIWELIEYPACADEICRKLACEYSADMDVIRIETNGFLDLLQAKGLAELIATPPSAEDEQRFRYLWLLKRALVNLIYPEHELRIGFLKNQPLTLEKVDLSRYLRDIRYRQPDSFQTLLTAKQGGDITKDAAYCFSHTMIGLQRLDNLECCAGRVFGDGIPGDFLEAGVCQGGAAIFMRALQVVHGQSERKLWAADSFQGLPLPLLDPDVSFSLDLNEACAPRIAFSLEGVKDNFLRYDLLDDGVRFIPGWFSDTLHKVSIDRLAILRVDADMYQSTREVLEALYNKVSDGGFVIVDDYGALPPCRKAVDEFRAERGIDEPLSWIDRHEVLWRKGPEKIKP
jgi:hypothetical protein